DAIDAVQGYVQRARLALEPGFVVTPAFVQLWEGRFASFRTWQACKRREIYRENWIEWDELAEARRTDAFRFLEDRLRRLDLTWPRNETGPALAAIVVNRPPQELTRMPLWFQAAMKLGTRFIRIAAAATPSAATRFVPRRAGPQPCCCECCCGVHEPVMDEY